MANIGPNSPSIEQLVASGTREIIASVEKQTTAILLRNREMFYESEKRLTDNIQRSEQSVITSLENTKAPVSKNWQLLVVLLPSVLTVIVGVALGQIVWALQIKTNQKIDTSSKQVSTRLALSTGKTYKLPPRTVSLIEALAHEYETKGKVLAAIAYMLSQPSLQAGLTRAPLNPRGKVVLEPGETPENHLRKHEREVHALTKRDGKKSRRT